MSNLNAGVLDYIPTESEIMSNGLLQEWQLVKTCINSIKEYTMKTPNKITQSRLKELVEYDPSTGVFISLFDGKARTKYRIRRGEIIKGCLTGKYYKIGRGYLTLYLDSKPLKAHRLAWIYCYGDIPDNMTVDHINQDTLDNRIQNLRLATAKGQTYNRGDYKNINPDTGVAGIRIENDSKSYRARVMFDGKSYSKNFNNIEDAIKWRGAMRDKLNEGIVNEFAT